MAGIDGWKPQLVGAVSFNASPMIRTSSTRALGFVRAPREVRGRVTIINAWAAADPHVAKGQPYRDEDVRLVCTACALPIVCCADCGRRFRASESIATDGCYVEQLVIRGSSRVGVYQTHFTRTGDVKTVQISVADQPLAPSSWWSRLLKRLHLSRERVLAPQERETSYVAVPNQPHRCTQCADRSA